MMVKRFLSVADHVIGRSVHDAVSEQIGTIKDVFIDPDSNRPLFVVLSAGGFLGIGSEHIVLPWHALSFNPHSNDIKFTRDRHELKNAPDVDINKLKKADREEIEKMTSFYGEGDFKKQAQTSNEADNSFERPNDNEHEGYEGSAKTTDEQPKDDSDELSRNADYERSRKLK